MTSKTHFSEREWQLLGDTPLAAAAAVAVAEAGGGGEREASAIVESWREAARIFEQSELLQALIADLDPEQREQSSPSPAAPASFHELRNEALNLCQRAIALLAERASSAEADDYRKFVQHIARRTATAASEGGLLGIGGRQVSLAEQAMLDLIAAALHPSVRD